MESIKWKRKNSIVYFKKFENFHLIHLIVETLDVLDVLSLLLSLISHSRVRFEHVFKKTYIKSGNITGKKDKTLKDF